MTPAAPHVIRTQSILIGSDDQALGQRLLSSATELWHGQLAPDTNAIFSEWCPTDVHVRFPQLLLDLGTIAPDDFHREFPERYRTALTTELRRLLGQIRAIDPDAGESLTRARSALELLEHLLQHGTLPWWAPHDAEYNPPRELATTLQEQPAALVQMLRRIGRRRPVRFRVVRWLADPEIAALIRAIAPGEAPFILRYAADLDARQEEEPFVAAPREEFRHAKWEVILGHLLADHGSRFNTLSFLRATLRGLAAHFRLDYVELLEEFARVAAEPRLDWRESSLPKLLLEIHAEDVLREGRGAGSISAGMAPDESRRAEDPQAWVQLVDRCLQVWTAELNAAPGTAAPARRTGLAFWRVLPREALPRMLEVLHSARGIRAVAERLATIFSEPERRILHQRLAALSRQASATADLPATIQRVLEQPTRLTGLDDEAASVVTEPGSGYWLEDVAAVFPAVRVALETGSMPTGPWAGAWRDTTEVWLTLVLARHALALPALLRAWARDGLLSRKIATTATAPVRFAVVAVLAPGHEEEIVAFVDTTVRVERARLPDEPSESDLRREVWQVVLDYVLVDHGSVFNRRSFLTYAIGALAGRRNLGVAAVLTLLTSAAERASRHELMRDLLAIAGDRSEPVRPEPDGVDANSAASTRSGGGRDERSASASEASLFAELQWLHRALAGDTTAIAVLHRLWPRWDATLTRDEADPAAPSRRRAAENAICTLLLSSATERGVRALVTAGGAEFLSRVVFGREYAQREIWEATLAWMTESAAAAQLFPGGRSTLRERLWAELVLLWRERHGRPIHDVGDLLADLLWRIGVRPPGLAAGASPRQRRDAVAALLATVTQGDTSAAARRLNSSAERTLAQSKRRRPAAPDPKSHQRNEPREDDERLPLPAEPIALHNAGLVLLAPFFPELHRRCGLLDGNLFRDFVANQRAVHVLQYLATGGSRAHEYSLVLNKLFCGLSPDVAVVPEVELTLEEKTAADQLLQHVASQWPRGAAISVEGLRSSYLIRPGKLQRQERSWRLTVERRGWDVLLPELPWSFPGVRPAWMPEPVHVDWI